MKNRLRIPLRLRFVVEPGEEGGGTFTQKQVDEVAARTRAEAAKQAKKAEQEALTAKLGGRTIEELLALAESAKAAEDAAKTEAQKALDAAQADKAEAAKDRLAAKVELHSTRVRAALLAAGVPEAGVAAVAVPGVTVDSTPEEITAAVETLKTALPGLFATAAATAGGDPGKGPAPKPPVGSFGEGGAKEFERRFGGKKS
jgi:hypothetical protein